MDSIHITLAANILKFRKRSGMSQETLAEALGVSNQAVSKWETAKTTPAVALLPQLADIFGCHIDELFGREVITERHFDLCTEFPWHDDTVTREVLCVGRKIMKVTPKR